jgi:hypothetical protein
MVGIGGAQGIGNADEMLNALPDWHVIRKGVALTVAADRPRARARGQGQQLHLARGIHAPAVEQRYHQGRHAVALIQLGFIHLEVSRALSMAVVDGGRVSDAAW